MENIEIGLYPGGSKNIKKHFKKKTTGTNPRCHLSAREVSKNPDPHFLSSPFL
jgi:hypothetical protein